MTNVLFSLLAEWKGFWWLREKNRRLASFVRARIYGFQHAIRERKTESGIFAELFKAVFWQLTWSVVIVAVFYWLDDKTHPLFVRWGLEIPMGDDGYTALLSTIAGIGGLFVGLYYTALSTVSGAIYARVPNNIRNLLSRDQTGNLYINFLSILTFSCVMLVASYVIGLGHVQSAIPVVAILAGVGILSFIHLGRRAFNFFDPTSLSETILAQLREAVKMAAHRDKNFQRHAHRLAADGIATLKTLTDICAKEPHLRGDPYAQCGRKIIAFLLFYQSYRCRIPTASLWYKQKYVHQEWQHMDSSIANVSHHAGMSLPPKKSGDYAWLDSELLPIIRQCVRINLEDKNWEIARNVLSFFGLYPSTLASLRQMKAAATALRVDGAIVLDEILSSSETVAVVEQKEEASVVEQVVIESANAFISYCNALREIRKEMLVESMRKIAWHRRDAVYSPTFPPHLLPCLEELKTHIDFERQVEGKNITPLWYQAEVVAREEADQFFANAKVVFDDFPALLKEWQDKAGKSKRLWMQAMIIQAEWRYHKLLQSRLHELKEAHESITGNQRVKEMNWRIVDFSAHEKNHSERGKEIIHRMSTLAPFLLLTARPEWVPDYPGQFMRCIGDAAMDALVDNDPEAFRRVFPSYFIACCQQFDRMRENIEVGGQNWRAVGRIRVAFAPLRDLLSLSGYARLMSDLHESSALWQVVVENWNHRLKNLADSSGNADGTPHMKMPQMLVLMLRDSKMTPTIDAGNTFRFNWTRKVTSELAKIPRAREAHDAVGPGGFRVFGRHDVTVNHPSKLVRYCAASKMLARGDGEDIFVLYYLRKHPDSEGIDFKEWDYIRKGIERA